MRGIVTRVAVIGLALIAVATEILPGQESAPVVKIRQPLGIVGTSCQCTSCTLGVPCACSGPNPTHSGYASDANEKKIGSAFDLVSASYTVEAPTAADEVSRCNAGWLGPGPGLVTSPDGVITGGCPGDGGGEGCGGHRRSAGCVDWSCLDLCCRQGFWIRADYLMWWTSEDDIPPLVTSSPLGTAIDDVGVLGLPTTTTDFEGPLADGFRSGGRLRFGYWPSRNGCGWEGSMWGLQNLQESETWSSAGSPAYARPFFNVDPFVNAQAAELVSYDGVLRGAVNVSSSSELYSGNLGLRRNLWCCTNRCYDASMRLDVTAGYRYFHIREGLQINESLESIALGGPVALGTRLEIVDRFRTTNEFHGGELGLMTAGQHGRWIGELSGTVALGNIARRVRIDGTTAVTVPNQPASVRAGGLLAQSTNIGDHQDSEFGVLPTFEANLKFAVSCNLKLAVGYSCMYLGEVVRPGDVVDPAVNGLLLDSSLPFSGPLRPSFDWNDGDLWVMGINLGLEYLF